MSLSLGIGKYDVPELKEYILANCGKAVLLDGYGLAAKAGSVKAVNIVLLGAACGAGLLPFDRSELTQTIEHSVAPRFVEMNLKAFSLGYAAGGKIRKYVNRGVGNFKKIIIQYPDRYICIASGSRLGRKQGRGGSRQICVGAGGTWHRK